MNNPIIPPVVEKMPAETYHADPSSSPSLSSTLARLLLNQSPLHAWTAHPKLNPNWQPEEKKTFDMGRAAHTAVLGVGEPYVAYPTEILASNGAASTKAAKEWAQAQRDAGRTPLKAEDVDAIGRMVDRVRDRLHEAQILLDTDRSEISAFADIAGCICRAMIDNAPEDPSLPLYDFKTTTDASPHHCTRAVMNYGYDVQAAHYLETWKAATGEDRKFRFIFQEKTEPFEVCVVELGSDTLTMARKKIARAREIWRHCVESDHWPGYPAGVHLVDLPEFFHERWLERESQEADYRQRTGHDILDQARRWQAPDGWQRAAE